MNGNHTHPEPTAAVHDKLIVGAGPIFLSPLPMFHVPHDHQHDALIRSGQPVASPDWSTLGTSLIDEVRHGLPRVSSFEVQPAPLGAAGRTYRLWCALHCQADAFSSSVLNAGTVAIDGKAAQRELKTI